MGVGAFEMGCGCGCANLTGCSIFLDEFSRANSTTIGSQYTENSGSWEIFDGYVKTTSSAAKITFVSGISFVTSAGVKLKFFATTTTVLKFYNTAETTKYIELTLDGADSFIRFYDSGDLQVEYPFEYDFSTWITIETAAHSQDFFGVDTDRPCPNFNGLASFLVFLDDQLIVNLPRIFNSYILFANHTGFAIDVTSNAGEFRFDDLAFMSELNTGTDTKCRPCPEYPIFQSLSAPSSINVVISDLTTNPDGSDYSAFNGSYILPKDTPSGGLHYYKLTGLSISYLGPGGTPLSTSILQFDLTISGSMSVGPCGAYWGPTTDTDGDPQAGSTNPIILTLKDSIDPAGPGQCVITY
jgi:hypothetical protein